MFPIVWEPFGYPISSFGLMMATGFLVATWITTKRMIEEGLDPELASTMLLYIMGGGILGSKLYFAIDVHLREGIPFTALLFSRDGITWYGGLIGAVLLGALGTKIHGVPLRPFINCVANAVPFGQALGRVGCFLVGDDYGKPSDLPWAVSFPKGAPPTFDTVHPTQLYEALWLVPVGIFLWKRRKKSPFLFGEYIALNGFGRIFIEHLRINPKVALGLTEPQIIGVALIVLGVTGLVYFRRRPQEAPA